MTAKRKPKNMFEKGNQAARGREFPVEHREARKLTRLQFEMAIYKYLYHTKDQLKSILENPGETPAYELMIVSILAKGIGGGDVHRMEALFNRVHGKVADRVEFEDKTDESTRQSKIDLLLKVAKEFK